MVMRWIAIFFYGVGLFFLMRRGTSGPEAGLIDLAVNSLFGGPATLIGLLFAMIHLAMAPRSMFARFLCCWGCLQFIGFLVYAARGGAWW
jgi:hypothetical protein